MRKLSIGLRLTLWYLAIFLLAEVIFGVGMWLILRQNLFDIADTALEGQASDLQRFLEARKDLSAAQLQAEISEDRRIERSEDYLQITESSGNSIYRSRFFEEHPLPPRSLDELDRPLYENRKLGHERFRLLSEQIDISGRVYIVRIGHPMHEEIETLDDFRQYLLWFAPLLLLGASAGGYWLSRRALAPVDALTRTARAVRAMSPNIRKHSATFSRKPIAPPSSSKNFWHWPALIPAARHSIFAPSTCSQHCGSPHRSGIKLRPCVICNSSSIWIFRACQ